MESVMLAHRLFLGLILAGGVATGVVLVGSDLSSAQNTEHLDHTGHMRTIEAAIPTTHGQEAFGTIQEIVRILEADPTTDWSKVNIAALREHLIDMDEVTMRAAAIDRALSNGVEITVTGQGRTIDAIKRIVPAHTHELVALGWQARTEDLPNGVKLVVTTADPRQMVKLKALGFMGIMVQGSHHQAHHLLMAKGEMTH
jgi:NAD(P)H-dependent flavin oxidoreductase YrpB (nitropropane dioxygenase family)